MMFYRLHIKALKDQFEIDIHCVPRTFIANLRYVINLFQRKWYIINGSKSLLQLALITNS